MVLVEQQCVSDNESRICAAVEPMFHSQVQSCTAASKESVVLSNEISNVSQFRSTEPAVWCTVCAQELMQVNAVKLHPNLAVMMCETCLNALEDRRTTMDNNKKSVSIQFIWCVVTCYCSLNHNLNLVLQVTMDAICYWCGSDEELNECSCCDLEWCSRCILRNIGDESLVEIDEDYCWTCFVCSPELLHGVKDELDFFMDVAAENGHDANCNHGILFKCR